MFIRNQWYIAGWDHEVGRTPLARAICNEPIVLYRKLDGTPVAMYDACPHRLLPLSMGLVEGDNLRCKYHGMLFDGQGACVEMPSQEQKAANFKVAKSFAVVERHRFIWVWIGDEPADPALVPDLWRCSHPDWAFDGGVYYLKADYRLMIDNLMDLTHETYVHPDTIGQAEILSAPIDVTEVDERVYVTRWMRGIDAPPFWRQALKKTGNVDRWQICEFTAPSAITIDVGVAPVGTGAPEGDRSQGVNGFVIDFITPETETTCWYYWGMARNFDVTDSGFTQRFKAQQGKVFAEDVEILEAQQKSMDANPALRLRTFNIDAGGARARAIIERKVKSQTS